MTTLLRTAHPSAFLALFAIQALANDERPFELMVGDPAPVLKVHWEKGSPVKEFKRGHVYVVEFWATWCPPCLEAIPHLNELQKKYGDKVEIVGVSVAEMDQVKAVPQIKKLAKGMDYKVAKDQVQGNDGDNGAMVLSWLNPAGQRGLPTSFIIDQQGRVAWIGYPLYLDEPLDEIVKGTWDTESYRISEMSRLREASLRDKVQTALGPLIKQKKLSEALEASEKFYAEGNPFGLVFKSYILRDEMKDVDAAFAVLDAGLKERTDSTSQHVLSECKFMGLWHLKRFDEASAFAATVLHTAFKEDWGMLNLVAGLILDPNEGVPSPNLDVALKAAQSAAAITTRWEARWTLAHAHYARGELDQAIAELEKCRPFVPDKQVARFEATLQKYKSERRKPFG